MKNYYTGKGKEYFIFTLVILTNSLKLVKSLSYFRFYVYNTEEELVFYNSSDPHVGRSKVDISDVPRTHIPKPTVYDPGEQIADLSAIRRAESEGRSLIEYVLCLTKHHDLNELRNHESKHKIKLKVMQM